MNYLYLLLITEIVFLLIHMAATKLDFTSPGFVTLALFILSTVCVIWNEDYWDVEFHPLTYWLVTAGLAVAIGVELIIKFLFQIQKRKVWIDQPKFAEFKGYQISVPVQFISAILFTGMMIIYVIAVVRAGGNDDLLTNIGVVHNDVEIEVGTLPTICIRLLRLEAFVFLYFFVCNVFVCRQRFAQNAMLLVPVLAAWTAIFFSGVRATFMNYLIAVFFYSVMLRRFKTGWKTVKLRKYFKFILIFGSVFVLLFIATRTIIKNHEFESTGFEYITFYLGSPLHLLDKLLQDTTQAFSTHYAELPGAHTFRLFYEELRKFGLISIEVEKTRFMAVGGDFYGGGNVYTLFGTTYHDYGFGGTMVYTGILYGVFSFVYYKAFRYCRYIGRSLTTLVVYGAYYYFIFMTFYTAMTCQLKIQTFLEMAIVVLMYKFLPRIKLTA